MSRSAAQVINLHAFGATVRLEDGSLAAVPRHEVELHRGRFELSLTRKTRLPMNVQPVNHGKIALLATDAFDAMLAAEAADSISLTDEAFEERLAAYLRATEDWAPPDEPQPFERHLLRKKRRSAQFR
ncbi:MAG: hypothetical protein ACRENA_12520 [Vulcanimicrobiaceae bacterium]